MSIDIINQLCFFSIWILLIVSAADIAVLTVYAVRRITIHIKDRKGHSSDNKKTVFPKQLILIMTITALLIMIITQVSGPWFLHMDSEMKAALTSITADGIDRDKFLLNEDGRTVYVTRNESTDIACTIEKQGSDKDDVYEYKNKAFLSKGITNDFGTIKISPVYRERYQVLFIQMYYGYLLIPISEQDELLLTYRCDTGMKDCKEMLLSVLKDIQKSS